MTIEERITNEFNSNFDDLDNPIKKSIVDDIKSLVIKCCKEQREIDIQRAVEWYCNRCKHGKTCAMRYSQDTCSKIKELKQAMKGE